MNKRNHYTPEFKAKVIMEVLKEAETISQIAQKYGIHANMISKWKKEYEDQITSIFKRGKTDAEKELKLEKERSEKLEKLVGQLTYEVDWLKKKSAQFGIKIRKA